MATTMTGFTANDYLSEKHLRHMVLDFIQMGRFMREPLVFDRGEGIWVWDVNGDKYLDEMIVKPARFEDGLFVEQEIRRVLGKKYQFDPSDERAVPMWNFIENEMAGAKIFRGINIFLAVIGSMSLIIAGVGVANIMYVVAKERTREIGIKRAVGAKKSYIIFHIFCYRFQPYIWFFPADTSAKFR